MALTNAQLQCRVEAIELKLNEIQTALNNLCTKRQMQALLTIRQTEIDDLKLRVENLEEEIAILQGNV